MAKVYVTPKVSTERLELGVFGSYGASHGGNGARSARSPWAWIFWWLFG